MSNVTKSLPAWLLLTLAPLFWSGNFFAGAVLKDSLPPFIIAFSRWSLVILLLTPFLFRQLKKEWPIIKANLHKVILLSFLSVTVYTGLIYLALHQTTVISAGMINATIPMMILCLSIVFKQDHINLGKILAMFCSFLGVLIIVFKGGYEGSLSEIFNPGDIVVLLACGSWALYSVLLKIFKLTISPFVFLYITAVFGTLLLIPFAWHEFSRLNGLPFNNVKLLCGLLYMAIFASILAFTCWNQGVKKIGPAKAGVYFNLLALFSAMWAILFLHDSVAWYHIVGAIMIFGSILYINFGKVAKALR